MSTIKKPNVLILAGHDPSGGAGVHADIEAVTNLGCHAASVITCLTLQDSRNAYKVWPLEIDRIEQQLKLLSADMQFSAIKLGLLATPEHAESIAHFIQAHFANVPLIVDPVLVASGGGELALNKIVEIYRSQLFPLAAVITPNVHEREALTQSENRAAQITELLATGCGALLLKGGDERGQGEHLTKQVRNTLYFPNGESNTLTWSRFAGEFHGSGCTLASAIAARLAQGDNVLDATTFAQSYTWEAIRAAYKPGKGQHIPNRQQSPLSKRNAKSST